MLRLLACCYVALAGAGFPQDLAAAVLRGVVVENSSGRPLARARVSLETLRGGQPGLNPTAFADSRGQFSFPSLREGSYLLSVQRPGYANAKYGQHRPETPGSPIVLEAEGQFFAEVRLRKLAAVSGQITDENGVGVEGVPVYAYRAAERLKPVGTAVSDDRGVYRISGLPAGRYYVRTAARQMENHEGLLPTFAPQAGQRQDARSIDVALDQEATDIDIRPLPGRLAMLTGTTNTVTPTTVLLFMDTGTREAEVEPGGKFSFGLLAPGAYYLLAETSTSPKMTALRRVQLGGQDQFVPLEMKAAPIVRIRCQEKEGRPLNTASVSLFLRRREPDGERSQRVACDQEAELTPGTWEFAAVPPAGMYVSNVANAQRGEIGFEFSLSGGPPKLLTVMFSSRPASLRGKVTTRDGLPAIGAPVYVQPLDPEVRSHLGGVRSTRCDADGMYRFTGLPPGRYEVLSSFQIQDPEEHAWPAGRGKSQTLEEGIEAEQDLTLVELDEP